MPARYLLVHVGLCDLRQLGEDIFIQTLAKSLQHMLQLLQGDVAVPLNIEHRKGLGHFILGRTILGD